jgi:ribokinase
MALHVPAPKVKVLDTVAAGDAFNGAFAVALARGDSVEDALRYANAAGTLSVTKRGAQPSLPRTGKVEGFVREV